MKLRLLCVGKLSLAYARDGVEEYTARLRRYLPFEALELREEKGGKKVDPAFLRERESRQLLDKILADAFVVVLDERGRPHSSEELAGLVERHMLEGTGELTLVIGGAYGTSTALRQRADLVMSLSQMTLTHQMARLLLMEQLYRALTIIRNEPYHNR